MIGSGFGGGIERPSPSDGGRSGSSTAVNCLIK